MPAPGVLANDSDVDGNPLTAQLLTTPAHGTLTWSATGEFTYTPFATFSGTDSFTYQVSDGSELSAPISVVIRVTPLASLPPAPPLDHGADTPTPTPLDPPLLETDPEVILPDESSPGTGGNETTGGGAGAGQPRSHSNSHDAVGPLPVVSSVPDHLPLTVGFLLDQKDINLTDGAQSKVVSVLRNGPAESTERLAPTERNPLLPTSQVQIGYEILSQNMREISDSLSASMSLQRYMVGSATVSTGALTVGYVMWTLRSSSLLASLLSTMPVWRFFDPLPIVQFGLAEDEDEKDESLADLIDRSAERRRTAATQSPDLPRPASVGTAPHKGY